MKTLNGCFIYLPAILFVTSDVVRAEDIQFENISIPRGLSNATVKQVYQDSFSFFRICTLDGLNRYDGYLFTVYKNIPGNPNSIIRNNVWKIAEDRLGDLWVATAGAGSRLASAAILSMAINTNGMIFAGTAGSGFYHSIDSGDTWHDTNSGLTNSIALSLAATAERFLFAGMSGAGVFRTNQSTTTSVRTPEDANV